MRLCVAAHLHIHTLTQSLAQLLDHSFVNFFAFAVGGYKDGVKHGHGKHVYASGDVYDGMYENNLKHGRGKLTIVSGQAGSYEGSFERGYKHGTGIVTFSDTGEQFEVTFEHDVKVKQQQISAQEMGVGFEGREGEQDMDLDLGDDDDDGNSLCNHQTSLRLPHVMYGNSIKDYSPGGPSRSHQEEQTGVGNNGPTVLHTAWEE